MTGDHLIAVCGVCHFIFTTLRRQLRRGADRFELYSRIEEAIASCSTESKSAGLARIIHHNGAAGLDTRSPVSREIAAIAAKRGGNRTAADDDRLRELEAQRALWLDKSGAPTIPPTAIRAAIRSRSPQAQARAASQGRVDGAEHFFPI